MNTRKSAKPFPNARQQVIAVDGSRQIVRISDLTGEGMMTFDSVLPGITFITSDFRMMSCESGFEPDRDILCIDHCREGRIEQEIQSGVYSYFQAGDLKVDRRLQHRGRMEMPTRHFHGISIVFDLDRAAESLREAMPGFPVDLYVIRQKYCDDRRPFVIPGEPSIEHIFSELYTIPLQIKPYYLRVKILELLLYLDALELSPLNKETRPYFYRRQVEKVKEIHRFLTENFADHYTLEHLAKRFDIPLTAMKSCFKSIYGNSVFAYVRTLRMHHAAKLLREKPNLSVAEIAGAVGYESPGKFSAAFKAVMGNTPLAYRKFPVQMERLWPDGEENSL